MAAVAEIDLHRMRATTAAPTELYSALSEGEIRLLSLLPGKSSDDITCRLMPSFAETASFEALSYTWGDPRSGTRTIMLNEIRSPVTLNLSNALGHLRSEIVGRVLWIDALCIDQTNNEEKGVQIQKMQEIYQAAIRVLI